MYGVRFKIGSTTIGRTGRDPPLDRAATPRTRSPGQVSCATSPTRTVRRSHEAILFTNSPDEHFIWICCRQHRLAVAAGFGTVQFCSVGREIMADLGRRRLATTSTCSGCIDCLKVASARAYRREPGLLPLHLYPLSRQSSGPLRTFVVTVVLVEGTAGLVSERARRSSTPP